MTQEILRTVENKRIVRDTTGIYIEWVLTPHFFHKCTSPTWPKRNEYVSCRVKMNVFNDILIPKNETLMFAPLRHEKDSIIIYGDFLQVLDEIELQTVRILDMNFPTNSRVREIVENYQINKIVEVIQHFCQITKYHLLDISNPLLRKKLEYSLFT